MPREQKQRTCVGTGLIVLDIIRNVADKQPAEMRLAGGSCGNVLTILSYFGWTTHAVGRIGRDGIGTELIRDLEKWGVQTTLLAKEASRRTPVFVQENYLDAKGRPRHRFLRDCPVCGMTLPPYRPLLVSSVPSIAEKLPPHSIFYFDRVSPGTLELARRSRSSGALVVFEPSGIRTEEMFVECLKLAHIFKYSNERISGIDALVERAKVPIEINTRGAGGLAFRHRANGRRGNWKDLPAFPVPHLRDSAGSGDWCTAGVIQCLASGNSLPSSLNNAKAVTTAIRYGQALAALNCSFHGARGLMYQANATKVLELASAIASGEEVPQSFTAKRLKPRQHRSGSTSCIACTSSTDRR
ncbi:MAG: hypothetical protein KDA51_10140 [Planctomycetales bacterium]|nr:hypothetical protein [Planctomycetales bacterium]